MLHIASTCTRSRDKGEDLVSFVYAAALATKGAPLYRQQL